MYYVPVFCMSKTARSVCEPKKSDGAREEKAAEIKHGTARGAQQRVLPAVIFPYVAYFKMVIPSSASSFRLISSPPA